MYGSRYAADTIPSLQEEIRVLERQRHYAGALYRRLVALRTAQLNEENRMDKRETGLVGQMATLLVEHGVDLADERDVIRKLNAAGFRGGDIAVLMDKSIEEARVRKAAWATQRDIA